MKSVHNGLIVEFMGDYVWLIGRPVMWVSRDHEKATVNVYEFRELVHRNQYSQRLEELKANPKLMGYPDVQEEPPLIFD